MVIVKGTKEAEAGELPTAKELAEMGAFNEELGKAGVLLAMEGLQSSAKGTRISFAGKKPVVTDGPFAETKELVAGFWIVQGKSKEEVVERFLRCPFADWGNGEIEIRQIFEVEDFGCNLSPEHREQEQRLRGQVASN